MRQYLVPGLHLSFTGLSWDRSLSHLVHHGVLCFCDPSSWPQNTFGGHLFVLCLSLLSFRAITSVSWRGQVEVQETWTCLGLSAPSIPWSHSALLLPCFSDISNNKSPVKICLAQNKDHYECLLIDWLEWTRMLPPDFQKSSFGLPKSSQDSIPFFTFLETNPIIRVERRTWGPF